MTHYLIFCKNCGIKYTWQGSGYYCLETPKEYNDREYCPECKQAIIEVLNKISKKSEIRYIKVNDFDIDDIIKYREKTLCEFIENNNKLISEGKFPLGIRVYPGWYSETKGSSTTGDFTVNNKFYIYSYYEKTRELISLTKKVRWDLINNKILSDEYIK